MRFVDDFLTFIGIYNANSRWYLFWGGIGSCLSEFAIFGLVWRKVDCHAKGCYRVGLHRVEGTPYITCAKHHPTHPGKRAISAEQIAQAHADAIQDPANQDPANQDPANQDPANQDPAARPGAPAERR